MTVRELAEFLNYEIVFLNDDAEIEDGYTSDLLSDVLGNAKEKSIIITIQSHKNTIAVAYQTDASAVLICSNREIDEEMINTAKKEGVNILRTTDNQYTASYKIYSLMMNKE